MANGWMGLNTALSGLRTAQQMLDISRPQHRERLHAGLLAPARARSSPRRRSACRRSTGRACPGQLGTGVQITSIDRIRDAFLDTQINEQVVVRRLLDRARGHARPPSRPRSRSRPAPGSAPSCRASGPPGRTSPPTRARRAARTAVLAEAQTLAVALRARRRPARRRSSRTWTTRCRTRSARSTTSRRGSRRSTSRSRASSSRATTPTTSRTSATSSSSSSTRSCRRRTRASPTAPCTVLVGGTDLVDHDTVRAITTVDDAAGHAVPDVVLRRHRRARRTAG